MFYAMECMRSTVYDWSTSFLRNMKKHLSDCKMGKVQNFGFSSILSTFFFEHVLGLSPIFDVPLYGVRDTTQLHWVDAMGRVGGGRVSNPYPADFFPWWQ